MELCWSVRLTVRKEGHETHLVEIAFVCERVLCPDALEAFDEFSRSATNDISKTLQVPECALPVSLAVI